MSHMITLRVKTGHLQKLRPDMTKDAVDIWEQLRLQEEQDNGLREAATTIRSKCAQEHGKKAIVDCPECYGALLEVFQSQFAPLSRPQWFSSRHGFVDEVNRMITAGKEYKVNYRTIDDRILAEKKLWILESLFSDGGSMGELAKDVFGRDEFQAKYSNRNIHIVDLLSDLLSKANSKGLQANLRGPEVHDKMSVDGEDSHQRLQMCKDLLFPDGIPNTPKAREAEQKLAVGVSLEQLLRDAKQSSARLRMAQEKEKKRNRIQEMTRAKAAHEAQKMKKKGNLEGDPSAVEEPISPCAECSAMPEPGSKQLSCELCWVEVDRHVRETAVSWCSVACCREGYMKHYKDDHPCSAGDGCILGQKDPTREVLSLDRESSEPHDFFCRECVVTHRIPARYCSELCAQFDFPKHRDTVHIPLREKSHLVVTDEGQLFQENSKYYAKDILQHLVPYEEAVTVHKKENPGWSGNEAEIHIDLD